MFSLWQVNNREGNSFNNGEAVGSRHTFSFLVVIMKMVTLQRNERTPTDECTLSITRTEPLSGRILAHRGKEASPLFLHCPVFGRTLHSCGPLTGAGRALSPGVLHGVLLVIGLGWGGVGGVSF